MPARALNKDHCSQQLVGEGAMSQITTKALRSEVSINDSHYYVV